MKLKDAPPDISGILTSVYIFSDSKPMDCKVTERGYEIAMITNANLILERDSQPHLFNVEVRREGAVIEKLSEPVGPRGGSVVHALCKRHCKP